MFKAFGLMTTMGQESWLVSRSHMSHEEQRSMSYRSPNIDTSLSGTRSSICSSVTPAFVFSRAAIICSATFVSIAIAAQFTLIFCLPVSLRHVAR